MSSRLQLLSLAPSVPRTRLPRRNTLRFAGKELAIWGAVYGTYLAVRGLTIGAPSEALRHAADVVSIERAVGIFHEANVQRFLEPVSRVFSTYYMLGFGPVIASFAIWLGLRRPGAYRELRNALLVSVSMASIGYVFFPTAPPRLAGLGIEDTVGLASHDTGSFAGIRFNPYAAVPSMHVGWSVIVAYIGFRVARRRAVRALFIAHPLLMATAVTATGNHFFFDAITGAAVAGLTIVLMRARERRAKPRLRVLEGGNDANKRLGEPIGDRDRRAA
jgi:hypothetical protein